MRHYPSSIQVTPKLCGRLYGRLTAAKSYPVAPILLYRSGTPAAVAASWTTQTIPVLSGGWTGRLMVAKSYREVTIIPRESGPHHKVTLTPKIPTRQPAQNLAYYAY